MEIKSYLKDIPQPPPPPIKQKRVVLDLSFNEFLLIVASVGVCENDKRDTFIDKHAIGDEWQKLVNSQAAYHLYVGLHKYARAANIVDEFA